MCAHNMTMIVPEKDRAKVIEIVNDELNYSWLESPIVILNTQKAK